MMENDRLDDLQDRVAWLERQVVSALRVGCFWISAVLAFQINKEIFPEKTWDFIAWGVLVAVWIGSFLFIRMMVFETVPKRLHKID
jgi:hypothetical protein